MRPYQIDSRIDAYIQTLPLWQQDICKQVREVAHTADSEVSETIKRTKLPYRVSQKTPGFELWG